MNLPSRTAVGAGSNILTCDTTQFKGQRPGDPSQPSGWTFWNADV